MLVMQALTRFLSIDGIASNYPALQDLLARKF
jgi:hypothetical protein